MKSEDLATKIKAGSYTLPDKVTFNSLALIITGVPNPENELQITFKE
ncbi:MAG: hypothetical protein U9Q15_01440 [Patescibacteria group bacterium]|nr:hypothetical protein [Patescibacteria group bacterium]